ncbi:UNVERIFIED_CONTAM: hypothetical protein PYX00_005272 [Menopon gallinae]|uniref:Myosin motor domain-containing protein n=1 Tax=Menopon gallinae TaxID=328185 RepID=A0AAW2HRV9_9NEOP
METALIDRERVGVDDFVLLEDYTSIDAFVNNLKKRQKEDIIYTNIGNVLISVNPYKELPIYTHEKIQQYRQSTFTWLPPHIYSVVDGAYRSLTEEHRPQCILISGESGSGKTEASKKVLQFVAEATNRQEVMEVVKNKLLQSNPLLEAFGNAVTNKNDNSSRFGKYMDVEFNFLGEPVGGKILNYLLEKSRVVMQNTGERNFHIFYQLLEGGTPAYLQSLHLEKLPGSYAYLNHHKIANPINLVSDAEQFKIVKRAMDTIEISSKEQDEIFSIVASILHLGNITFEDHEHKTGSKITNMQPAKYICELLGCDEEQFEYALTHRTIEAPADTVITPLNKESSMYARDALSKAVYTRLFTWLVSRLNKSLIPAQDASKTTVLGILDIYGFEVFQKNSYEQFCINYCNEKLQQLFIELTLKGEQEEYLQEGIEWVPIEYFNNKVICELIEEKHKGIIGMLNEECLRPGDTSDQSFLDKMNKNLATHRHYISHMKSDAKIQKTMERAEFRLLHYAGEVIYNVNGFLDKNNDLLFRDLVELMAHTKNSITKGVFTLEELKSKKRPETAINQFKTSLNKLIETLMNKQPSYIRCIKPNDLKKPDIFDDELKRVRSILNAVQATEQTHLAQLPRTCEGRG